MRTTVSNRLIQMLPANGREKLLAHGEFVDLPLRTTLVEPDMPTDYVHFIESGLASVVANSRSGTSERIEVGHIGYEGFAGFHFLLNTDRTPTHTFMQVAGSAWRIPSAEFKALLQTDQVLRDHLLRYVHTYQVQIAYSTLANGRYAIPQRLARWLLMTHDRLRTDQMPLTHEFLSVMLGVRRSGVTNEMHVLEGEHAISSNRALVTIRDRAKLKEMAGGSYGAAEAEYERVFGGEAPSKPEAETDLKGKRILLVEDEYTLAAEMERDLAAEGAEIVGPVPSVKDALSLVLSTPALDAAIVDINLEGEMAFPLAEALRERGIPFVFVSGYQQDIVPDEFRNVRFYSKPIDPVDIATKMLGAE